MSEVFESAVKLFRSADADGDSMLAAMSSLTYDYGTKDAQDNALAVASEVAREMERARKAMILALFRRDLIGRKKGQHTGKAVAEAAGVTSGYVTKVCDAEKARVMVADSVREVADLMSSQGREMTDSQRATVEDAAQSDGTKAGLAGARDRVADIIDAVADGGAVEATVPTLDVAALTKIVDKVGKTLNDEDMLVSPDDREDARRLANSLSTYADALASLCKS